MGSEMCVRDSCNTIAWSCEGDVPCAHPQRAFRRTRYRPTQPLCSLPGPSPVCSPTAMPDPDARELTHAEQLTLRRVLAALCHDDLSIRRIVSDAGRWLLRGWTTFWNRPVSSPLARSTDPEKLGSLT